MTIWLYKLSQLGLKGNYWVIFLHLTEIYLNNSWNSKKIFWKILNAFVHLQDDPASPQKTNEKSHWWLVLWVRFPLKTTLFFAKTFRPISVLYKNSRNAKFGWKRKPRIPSMEARKSTNKQPQREWWWFPWYLLLVSSFTINSPDLFWVRIA